MEEIERSIIKVSNILLEADQIIMHFLKVCWKSVKIYIHILFQKCLNLMYYLKK